MMLLWVPDVEEITDQAGFAVAASSTSAVDEHTKAASVGGYERDDEVRARDEARRASSPPRRAESLPVKTDHGELRCGSR